MMGSTMKAPLFKSYQGRDIVAMSQHTHAVEDLLFPLKGNTQTIEPQRITRDQWIQEQNNDVSTSEIRKLIKDKKLLQ